MPTVGRAIREPLLSWLVAYGTEAGAAGHPGVLPWPPAAARDSWGPGDMQLPGRILSAPGTCSQPCSSGLWVVLAELFIPLEDSSMAPQGHLPLHKSHKLCPTWDGGGWRDGDHQHCIPISAPLRGVSGYLHCGGASQGSLGHLTATATARVTSAPAGWPCVCHGP